MTNAEIPAINEQIVQFEQNNSFALEKIRAENDILKKITTDLPGSVYWKSRDGKFLGCNKNMAEIFGYRSPDEVIGKFNAELFDPAIAAGIDEIDEEIYKSGVSKTLEEYGVNRGQQAIYISKKTPLFDNKGNVIGLLGVSFDITERKRMEEALKIAKEQAEEANRSKTEFITNLSHDVKTPLAGIIGISELLTYRLNAEELDFAKILLISSRQLLAFFDNCLEVFKLENSNAILISERFNLKKTTEMICDIFLPTIKSRGLQLKVDYPDTMSEFITGSRTGIYRIMLNLVSNAVKFTPHGSVTIRVREVDQKLRIIVEDTGIGIPSNKQQAIFDQFTRLIPSYKGTYDGSGIGLYIVHKFVASMNGTVEVLSEPERGSLFTITLPLYQENQVILNLPDADKLQRPSLPTIAESTANTAPAQINFSQQNPINILLVEDNQIVQRIQSLLLNSFGCNIDIAETGEQALDTFQPGKYDLVIMDIGLPDMQGTLTAKLIRKLERGSGFCVPIIALTAHISENASSAHIECGINDTMQKPLSREQAKEVINRYVAKRAPKKSQHLDSVKRMLII